jgi:hypothetical protein
LQQEPQQEQPLKKKWKIRTSTPLTSYIRHTCSSTSRLLVRSIIKGIVALQSYSSSESLFKEKELVFKKQPLKDLMQ